MYYGIWIMAKWQNFNPKIEMYIYNGNTLNFFDISCILLQKVVWKGKLVCSNTTCIEEPCTT
jgi:hypothetical protein